MASAAVLEVIQEVLELLGFCPCQLPKDGGVDAKRVQRKGITNGDHMQFSRFDGLHNLSDDLIFSFDVGLSLMA